MEPREDWKIDRETMEEKWKKMKEKHDREPKETQEGTISFFLQEDGHIIEKIPKIAYYGYHSTTISSTSALHVGFGVFSGKSESKTIKVNDNLSNRDLCNGYLTNERLLLVRRDPLDSCKEGSIIFMAQLHQIKKIFPRKSMLGGFIIDFLIKQSELEINTVSVSVGRKKEKRDNVIHLIHKTKEEYIHSIKQDNKHIYKNTDSINILKVRLAKGEITQKQFSEIMILFKEGI